MTTPPLVCEKCQKPKVTAMARRIDLLGRIKGAQVGPPAVLCQSCVRVYRGYEWMSERED